jgi:hypothetical protein
MPRRLTKLRVDEVSTVDRGAGVGTEIVLRKNAAAANFRRIFGVETLRDVLDKAAANPALPRLSKARGGLTVDDLTDDDVDGINSGIADRSAGEREGSTATRHISHLADLTAEATGMDRASVLYWLLHHKDGLMLIQRTLGKRLKKKENETMTTRNDELASICKQDGGIAAACDHILKRGSDTNISEHEFVDAVTKSLVRRDGESPAQAFARVYTSDDGLAIRKAVAVLKGRATLEPVQVGGEEARALNDPEDALAQLWDMVARLRASGKYPELSKSQLFAKAYEQNPVLAAQERRQARARLVG